MQTKPLLVLMALGVAFGSAFLFMKVCIEEISATEIVAGRLALGAATAAVVMLVMRRRPRVSPSLAGGAAALAVFDSIVPFTLIAWAEGRIDSGVASIVASMMPLFTVLFAAATLPDEKLTSNGLLGVMTAFLGVIVLGGSGVTDLTSASTLGILAVVAASASYGVAAVIARRLLCDNDALELTGVKLSIGAIMAFGVTAAIDGLPSYGALSAQGGMSLVALGVFSTSVAFAVFLWTVRQVGSVKASLVTYVVPVVGLLLGWLVLGESIGPNTLLGALLIAGGMYAVMHHPSAGVTQDAPAGMACPPPLFGRRGQCALA